MEKHRKPKLTASLRVALEPEMKLALEEIAASTRVTLADVVRGLIGDGLGIANERDDADAKSAQRIRRAVGQALAAEYTLPDDYARSQPHTTCGEFAFSLRVCERLGLNDVVIVLRQANRLLVTESVLSEEFEDKELLEDECWNKPLDEISGEDRDRVDETLFLTQVVFAAFHEPYRLEVESVDLAKERLRKAYLLESADQPQPALKEDAMIRA